MTPKFEVTFSGLNTEKLMVYNLKKTNNDHDGDEYESLVVTCITHPSLRAEFGTVEPVIRSRERAQVGSYKLSNSHKIVCVSLSAYDTFDRRANPLSLNVFIISIQN